MKLVIRSILVGFASVERREGIGGALHFLRLALLFCHIAWLRTCNR